MTGMGLRQAYLTLRTFVDWDIRTNRRPFSTAIPFLPIISAIIADRNHVAGTSIYWPIACLLSCGLLMFVGWRLWLHLSTCSRDGDALYDRKTKYLLPPEYADTMSASEARRQRQRKTK